MINYTSMFISTVILCMIITNITSINSQEKKQKREKEEFGLSGKGERSGCADRYLKIVAQSDLSHEAVRGDQLLRLTSPVSSLENRHSPLTVSKSLTSHPMYRIMRQ